MITADIIMNSLSLSQITKQDDNVQEIEAVTKENDELKEVLSAVQTDLQDKRAVRYTTNNNNNNNNNYYYYYYC